MAMTLYLRKNMDFLCKKCYDCYREINKKEFELIEGGEAYARKRTKKSNRSK